MKYSQLKRLLSKEGCYCYEQGKNHEKWINPKTNSITVVGRHDKQEVKTGTLNAILKDLNIRK